MAYGPKPILFEAISNILCMKSEEMFNAHVQDEEHWKTFSKFMILRYMTMSYSQEVRDLVLDRYVTLERMPEKALYRWLLDNVPRQSSGFIRYIK